MPTTNQEVVSTVLSLNDRIDAYGYNCGGFALGTMDWFVPAGYRTLKCDDFRYSVHDALEEMADNMLREFPDLRRVRSPRGVPSSRRVIGFRVDYHPESWRGHEFGDFHFILREEGVWFEKTGGAEVTELPYPPMGVWDCGCYKYNSPIVWFVDESDRDFTEVN